MCEVTGEISTQKNNERYTTLSEDKNFMFVRDKLLNSQVIISVLKDVFILITSSH